MTTIQIPIGNLTLNRLDNCTWSFQRHLDSFIQDKKTINEEIHEVRVQTPIFSTPGHAYELALTVANVLQSNEIFEQVQKNGSLLLEIQRPKGFLKGRWLLKRESSQKFVDKYFQWIPFVKMYPSHHFVVVEVKRPEKGPQPSLICRVKNFVTARQPLKIEGITTKSPIEFPFTDWESFSERLKQKPFSDPFTQLATQALQTVETDFVSERDIQGSCRLALNKEGQLRVALISLNDDPLENQRTVRKYRDFVLKEFGPDHVEYTQYAYGFNFNDMIKRALPLLSDHVFKMNVGVNNVEMRHIEDLFKKLHLLRLDLTAHPSKKTLEEILDYYHSAEAPVHLCMREIRGLLASGKGEIINELSLKAFLDRLIGNVIPDHLPHLMPEQFNALVEMLWLAPEDLERALTGRLIRHLAICGYKTMGSPNQHDSSRDQAELLQLFPDLQKSEDWDNFYELLAHVAVKKTLYRKYLGENNDPIWRAGLLIPAPQTKEKTNRWYCVSKVYDDGEGNLSYILLPAAKGYRLDNRSLPMIHLYRSTNSNRNAIDSVGSIENDLNPRGAPGSLGEAIPQNYKGGFFFNRTIPLWVAQLIYGVNQKSEDAIHSYREALVELERYLKDCKSIDDDKLDKTNELQSSENAEEMRSFLIAQAENLRELPKYKRAQDLVFIGHSLGGALAQYGVHYFGPGVQRIPCPGYHFICRAYNGPATNASVDREFMAFGRKYRDLIKGLGQHWQIFHQFEYGDFVPEAGENHLGTDKYNFVKDQEWLDIKIQIFRPMEVAHALPITTCPTHGRRIGQATPNADFRLNTLTPAKLFEYDHSWFLSRYLQKTFGYRIMVSPRITEIMRRSIGVFGVPMLHFGAKIHTVIHPESVKRDRRGIFSCEYRAAPLQPQYWVGLQKKLGEGVKVNG